MSLPPDFLVSNGVRSSAVTVQITHLDVLNSQITCILQSIIRIRHPASSWLDTINTLRPRQYSNIGSNNGLVPARRQAIIWTNDCKLIDAYMGGSASMRKKSISYDYTKIQHVLRVWLGKQKPSFPNIKSRQCDL